MFHTNTRQHMIKIITYDHRYRDDFIRLNTEWINTYFRVETSDLDTFSHTDDIVRQGGQIFLAQTESGEVVGCCALKHHEDNSYELAKMAVSPAHQGQHIGLLLGESLLSYARNHGVERIFLEGNTRLAASIALYRRLGFQEVAISHPAYERCDIMMEWRNKPTETI